ncbi:hypothetical protein [Kribbella sp. NPDC023855]|uniref:hypothetical protein n=1 Tax=Kribbella sp. NPDC023855 TaxID=3154698 RepID=UPI0033C3A535
MDGDARDWPAGHRRPEGMSDETLAALGALSEALEKTIRARGHLYSFHQLTGEADFGLDEAVEALRKAGHEELADRIDSELIGRNVLPGRWTFKVVEDYDDQYYEPFVALEREARQQLAGGKRHLHEAQLKRKRATPGRSGHEMDAGELGG